MKSLRNIIALFISIFIGGIIITVILINATLKTKDLSVKNLNKQQDSVVLVKNQKKE